MAFADSARRKGPRKKFTTCCACHKICILRLTKCCACHRNLHFEVHKVRRLPRNLPFSSRFAKCCSCYEIYTSRFAKCCACHEVCAPMFTKRCACHEICTSRFTCRSLDKAFRRKNVSKDKKAAFARDPPISEKLRFTAPVTRSEHVEDHHRVQSAAPATKSALGSTPAPIPCGCHEKPLLDRQSTRFPLRLPENARSTTTRAQSKCTSRISKNNSDMAGPDRATPRLNTGPVWGNIYYIYSLNKYFSPCVFGDCIPMLIPMKSHGSGITLHKT